MAAMLTASIIAAKRDHRPLAAEDIETLIRRYVDGQASDAQMAAFAMAVCMAGMNDDETVALTKAMLDSGDRLPVGRETMRLDKHSTGGLGDKVSLILAPMIAAMGYEVPMISGRGLGITGGTLDKLESIAGFRTDLSNSQIDDALVRCGCVITGATESIAPADRRLYAVRDVTATVPSIPLITASILSKKLAASLSALVLDVKVGRGAFMTDMNNAEALAGSLTRVAGMADLPAASRITDMDQPLGWAVGNAVEVVEAIEVLSRRTSSTLSERVETLTIDLAATVVATATQMPVQQARQIADRTIRDGSALERFQRMVAAQSGRSASCTADQIVDKLDIAPEQVLTADRDGHVASVDCQRLGMAVVSMGGGRRHGGERIDHSVGLRMHVQIGDPVRRGDPVLSVYHRGDPDPSLAAAIEIVDHPVARSPLIRHRV